MGLITPWAFFASGTLKESGR